MLSRMICSKPYVPHEIIKAEFTAAPNVVEALFQTISFINKMVELPLETFSQSFRDIQTAARLDILGLVCIDDTVPLIISDRHRLTLAISVRSLPLKFTSPTWRGTEWWDKIFGSDTQWRLGYPRPIHYSRKCSTIRTTSWKSPRMVSFNGHDTWMSTYPIAPEWPSDNYGSLHTI